MSNPTADDRGYGFAAFRSHALCRDNHWCVPGVSEETISREDWVTCACGEGYRVHDDYHYHDMDGMCHNKKLCLQIRGVSDDE